MPETIHVAAATPAADGQPPRRVPAWLPTVARLCITIVLAVVIVRNVDLNDLLDLLQKADWRWSLAGVALGLVGQVIAGIRWALLARPIGFTYSLGRFVWRFFEGSFFSLCLPSSIGGDVVKAIRLADSTSQRILAGCTVLADRLAGLAALCVLFGTALISAEWSLGTRATIGTGMVLMAAAVIVFRLGVGSLDRLLTMIPAPHPARHFISQLLPYQAQPTLMTHALAWSLFIQLGNVLSVSLIARGLGVILPFSAWCVAVPAVMLAMVVPITINGAGVREGGLVMMLAPHAVPKEQAVAIALMWFLGSLINGLIGGLLFLLDRRPADSQAGAAAVH